MLEFRNRINRPHRPHGVANAVTTRTTHLPVTIVSSDRELLRELSWTLSLFGYQVTASCDFSEESPWRRSTQPGLLLLDARSGDEVDEVLTMPRSAAFTYRIAIDEGAAAEQLLLEGADDVVRYPVNTGELLTRLRAGVRRLEFERRLAIRGHRDAATGILTRRSLERALEKTTTESDEVPASCVVCGIDHLPLLREQYGAHAVRNLTATLARCIQHSLGAGELCGVLDDDQFIATLCRPVGGAIEFAEAVAREFASSDTLVREIRALPSLSAVAAEWASGAAADQFDTCQSIFEHVQSYGGNHIVRADEVQHEIATWRANMDAGVPFEDVVAQDMMERFPIVLTGQQVEAGYVQAIPTPKYLRVPCIPVVDAAGKLVGEVPLEQLEARGTNSHSGQPETVSYDQPLSELFESFSASQSEYLVVVDDTHSPVGYVTCEALASLVLDRIDASNYESPSGDATSIASLVVPVEPVRSAVKEPALAM